MSLYLPQCRTCHRTKKPIGRDQGLAASYCDTDCEGYAQEPIPPQFWSREEELETHLERVLRALEAHIEADSKRAGIAITEVCPCHANEIHDARRALEVMR